MIIHARSTKERKLTDLQWVVLVTIMIEPFYCFTGSEKKVAERMRLRGYLRRSTRFQYALSEKGKQQLMRRAHARAR